MAYPVVWLDVEFDLFAGEGADSGRVLVVVWYWREWWRGVLDLHGGGVV